VIEKFPFRIREIRTDRGHEFQAKFHWHVEDQSIRHVYIKPRSPQLNGKVERSHRSDQEEFYQLLNYVDDQDLNKKLEVWEKFYNFSRPHGAFGGQAPYEILREKGSLKFCVMFVQQLQVGDVSRFLTQANHSQYEIQCDNRVRKAI
jgi:transposase InsO family protein